MKQEVHIFTLSTCIHCKYLKKFLDDFNVKYDFKDVDLLSVQDQEAVIEDVRKINPDCTFPTSIIGDRVIVGFKEKEIREALGI